MRNVTRKALQKFVNDFKKKYEYSFISFRNMKDIYSNGSENSLYIFRYLYLRSFRYRFVIDKIKADSQNIVRLNLIFCRVINMC